METAEFRTQRNIEHVSPVEFQEMMQEFLIYLSSLEVDAHHPQEMEKAAFIRSAIKTLNEEKVDQANFSVKLSGVHNELNQFLDLQGFKEIKSRDRSMGKYTNK